MQIVATCRSTLVSSNSQNTNASRLSTSNNVTIVQRVNFFAISWPFWTNNKKWVGGHGKIGLRARHLLSSQARISLRLSERHVDSSMNLRPEIGRQVMQRKNSYFYCKDTSEMVSGLMLLRLKMAKVSNPWLQFTLPRQSIPKNESLSLFLLSIY